MPRIATQVGRSLEQFLFNFALDQVVQSLDRPQLGHAQSQTALQGMQSVKLLIGDLAIGDDARNHALEEVERILVDVIAGGVPIEPGLLTPLEQALLTMGRIGAIGDQEQKVLAELLQLLQFGVAGEDRHGAPFDVL